MVHHQAGEADAAVALGRRGLATARRCDDDATVVLAFLLLAPLARVVKGATAELPDAAEMVERARSARQTKLLSRSEEHTSELQSLMRISYAVFCLKKKTLSTT